MKLQLSASDSCKTFLRFPKARATVKLDSGGSQVAPKLEQTRWG